MNMLKAAVNICWFRRDLRLTDNAALYYALRSDKPVLCLFVYDTNILEELDRRDARVQFIYLEIERMNGMLTRLNSGMTTYNGTPAEAFQQLTSEYDISEVFTNHDYESYAIERDKEIASYLQSLNITFRTFKDQVIFDRSEVVKDNGEPYVVYTPYSRKWKEKLTNFYLTSYPCEKYYHNLYAAAFPELPSLETIGFEKVETKYPSREPDDGKLRDYDKSRNFPAQEGTSRLGIHLRFGTISIRALVRSARKKNEVFLNELIWREFYMMILFHFPHVARGAAFKPEYDRIEWRNNETEFQLWCEGKTGYPMVDAGMRQMNATGFMHNRVRMVTASFLSKHLLIDWRWGEAYFAAKLLDYDFAANNGGWQWSAGSGCDAAPYFRIFNPTLQAKRFDPKGAYINKWVPELNSFDYPSPIVDHEFARKRCLEVYGKAIASAR